MSRRMEFDLYKELFESVHEAVNDGSMDMFMAATLTWAFISGDGDVSRIDILPATRSKMGDWAPCIDRIKVLSLETVDFLGVRVAETVDLRAADNWTPESLTPEQMRVFLAAMTEAILNVGGQLAQQGPDEVKMGGKGASAVGDFIRDKASGEAMVRDFMRSVDEAFPTYDKGGGEA